MLKIRLQRVGRVHEPSFRLVLTDSKNSTKSGRFAEVLGSYDPRKITEAFNKERIQYWLGRGAGLTASVNNLLIKKRIISGKKIHVSTIPPPTPAAEEKVAESATIETEEKVEEKTEEKQEEKAEEVTE